MAAVLSLTGYGRTRDVLSQAGPSQELAKPKFKTSCLEMQGVTAGVVEWYAQGRRAQGFGSATAVVALGGHAAVILPWAGAWRRKRRQEREEKAPRAARKRPRRPLTD